MSKLSQLKQEAYQAGKKKDWERAISLYEKILEKDKNNPTVINELGDLCLKSGESSRAVRHFLNAASKYRGTGLLNNAVAIYKKILRYDDSNPSAHWYLAETRAEQGFAADGEAHALRFLESSQAATGDIKEIFLKRCGQLFELLPDSRPVQETLVQIFRAWSMDLEAARAQCLLAVCLHGEGETEAAEAAVAGALEKSPEAANYPEHQRWILLVDPDAAAARPAGGFNDFGAVDLGNDETAAAPEPARPDEPVAAERVPTSSESEASPVRDTGLAAQADPSAAERDDEGCFSIGDDGDDLQDLIDEATGVQSVPAVSVEPDPPAPGPASRAPGGGLLDQLLAEDDGAAGSDGTSELETITSEIGAVVGGEDGDDAARLYEMGTVYLEMGLFDQACDSFETAAADDEYSVRAHEMWGITLQRANRLDEAVRVLTDGLEAAETGSREEHGLRYHLGRAHEAAGDMDAAAACYRTIKDVDPTYLDVSRRLKRLVSV